MFVSYRDSSVRLTGRWDTTDDRYAEATATGSYIEFAFEGKTAVACFDIEGNRYPFLHLWVQLDGGDMFECPLDAYLRVMAKTEVGFIALTTSSSSPYLTTYSSAGLRLSFAPWFITIISADL